MALTITFLGHSGFLLHDGVATLAIDPFLTGNPLAVHRPAEIRCDYIALTHGHSDHIGDTVEIARRNNSTVIGVAEVVQFMTEEGVRKTEPGNPGGRIATTFGAVHFTPAFHSSSCKGRYMGMPCGLVIEMGGVTMYHAGDTGLFSDMRLIGELYRPAVAALPIGDRFTMGPEMATRAAELVGARIAIPMHYATFPLLVPDAQRFAPAGMEVRALAPGESISVTA